MTISSVTKICNAYEAGFGTGMELKFTHINPYFLDTEESKAWSIGLKEGEKRSMEIEKNKITLSDRFEAMDIEKQMLFNAKFTSQILTNATIKEALKLCDLLIENVPDEQVILYRSALGIVTKID